MKIVVSDPLTFEESQLNLIRATVPDATVVQPPLDRLASELSDAEIFFGYHAPEIFDQARLLRWIQTSAAGLDRLLTPTLVQREVLVSNASGVHAPAVVEQAWALTLSLARGLPTFLRQQMKHEWKWASFLDLAQSTAGIIGLGGIGRQYARVAAAFDMRVIAVDLHTRQKPAGIAELWGMDRLHDLLRQSDVVLIAVPYTPETRDLIHAAELACMKPTALLINIARGGIINEPALIDALQSRRIAGAGLDVCEIEPLPADNPLWDAPNLVLSPHCAGLSSHRRRRLAEFFCDNLRRYLRKEPLRNLVDKGRGYPVPVL